MRRLASVTLVPAPGVCRGQASLGCVVAFVYAVLPSSRERRRTAFKTTLGDSYITVGDPTRAGRLSMAGWMAKRRYREVLVGRVTRW